jgi:DNA topoisomerase-1
MSKTLIIVESPGKIKSIQNYLGSNYIIKACCGHLQDLDRKTLSIDIENNFKPLYVINKDYNKIINDLKKTQKECNEVILATDEDREGEMISYSLVSILDLHNPKRITFHEITKNALLNAIKNYKPINMDMVYAQQARRILDRLVGYKISPLLWKYFNDPQIRSAGRVQSVVIKIIIDKEQDINNIILNSYLKTNGIFILNKKKLLSTLNYNFDNIESSINFLKLINKNTEIKIKLIENKESIKKPSSPFITSTLQQEAYTKLNFSVKETMEYAQKLYEAGYITYMRTDSPNISNEIIELIKLYIIDKYGIEYSEPKNFKSKNNNAQESHECIRPTNINLESLQNFNIKATKLYELIWKRIIASQMNNAIFNIQIIYIDLLNNNNSILNFINNQTYFISNIKNIKFNGYLIIYDNIEKDSDIETNEGFININKKDILKFNNIIIKEEYKKLPLRYNEAGLIKYLEKNGIGRPSTYSSIISKIIDRKYIEIKNIEGNKQECKILELNNKLIINEKINEIFIGKEENKLIPTEIGININDFMNKNFESILQINFTADFESYLDKISNGEANIVTVLQMFYNMFEPMVNKLLIENKSLNKDKDILLGINNNGNNIYKGTGKYGPYVKILIDEKWNYASVKNNDITLEQAIELLKFPIEIGKINNNKIYIYNGEYGYYTKYNNQNYSLKNEELENINIDYIRKLIIENNVFTINKKVITIKNGKYGYYLEIKSGTKKTNLNIPIKYDVKKLNINDIQNIMNK